MILIEHLKHHILVEVFLFDCEHLQVANKSKVINKIEDLNNNNNNNTFDISVASPRLFFRETALANSCSTICTSFSIFRFFVLSSLTIASASATSLQYNFAAHKRISSS